MALDKAKKTTSNRTIKKIVKPGPSIVSTTSILVCNLFRLFRRALFGVARLQTTAWTTRCSQIVLFIIIYNKTRRVSISLRYHYRK